MISERKSCLDYRTELPCFQNSSPKFSRHPLNFEEILENQRKSGKKARNFSYFRGIPLKNEEFPVFQRKLPEFRQIGLNSGNFILS